MDEAAKELGRKVVCLAGSKGRKGTSQVKEEERVDKRKGGKKNWKENEEKNEGTRKNKRWEGERRRN